MRSTLADLTLEQGRGDLFADGYVSVVGFVLPSVCKSLLNDMGQLVGQGLHGLVVCRPECSVSQEDVLADGEGVGVKTFGRGVCLRVVIYANFIEII